MAKSMAVLDISSAFFRLPEGFEGTVEDAVLLFAKYFVEHKSNSTRFTTANAEDANTSRQNCWERFTDSYPHDDVKFCGAIGVQRYDIEE